MVDRPWLPEALARKILQGTNYRILRILPGDRTFLLPKLTGR